MFANPSTLSAHSLAALTVTYYCLELEHGVIEMHACTGYNILICV